MKFLVFLIISGAPCLFLENRLDVYIHDYLVKRDLKASAQAFQAEGKVSSDPVAIDAPGGFLFEWWSVFWDIFIARTNEKHSEVAASYIEVGLSLWELYFVSILCLASFLGFVKVVLESGVRPYLLDAGHEAKGRESLHLKLSNALATKMYEERLKLPLRDSLDDAALKQKFGENVGQLLDPNPASILKSAAAAGQPSGQVLHGTAGAMSPQVQSRNQQLPGSTPEIKTEMNPVLNPRSAGPEGSLIGIPGSNQGGNNLTLKGWPLTGLDQLRSGLLQQQKSFMQGPHPYNQLQMLTPQHQQQLMLAQQNLTSPSGNDESRRLRMLLNNRSMSLGKDGLTNPVGDVVPNIGSPLQAGCPVLPRGDPDMLLKVLFPLMIFPRFKILVTADGSMSNSFRGNDQPSKNQTGRKRKQPVTSSGPANSSGTANTAGPSPSSAPSTPSTHTPGDVMSMPVLPHSGTSKPLMMFGTDGAGTLTSPSNQLWDDKDLVQADMDRFVEDGSLDDNVESFLSHDDTDPRDPIGRCMDVSKGESPANFLLGIKVGPAVVMVEDETCYGNGGRPGIASHLITGFTFTEVSSVRASGSKVVCCHFSSDGKLLASGGHDKKAVLWSTDTLKAKSTLEEHSAFITDVRFSPSMPRLATSSFDKTVRVWDADNPGYSLRTFTGHSASVISLDFHPNKDDLICSCDEDGEIRYWSINNGSCARVFKGGSTQMRFQPRLGRYLAAAAENVVSILDVETQVLRHSLQVSSYLRGVRRGVGDHCGPSPAVGDHRRPPPDTLQSRFGSPMKKKKKKTREEKKSEGGDGMGVVVVVAVLEWLWWWWWSDGGVMVAMSDSGGVMVVQWRRHGSGGGTDGSGGVMVVVEWFSGKMKGHTKTIHSVCWDPSGEFLASVSEDSVRVWTLGSGSEGDCVHELSCNGNKFQSCVFHPSYASLLVIGCYQSLELWNMSENKTMTLPAHEGLIAGLAVSPMTGLVASASHDKFVKLWK
ncbi:hypothetical protein C3L33_08928, partial [Rhododendron williamsianum]